MGAVQLAGGELPWHWNLALLMCNRIETIIANAASDPDGLVAPKELWFSEDELKDWYDDRHKLWQKSIVGT